MKTLNKTLIALAAALASAAALADVNIGVSLSLTGPGSGLGIPMQNYYKIFPQTIAGEKVNLIILDDASDPGKGVSNARRFVTDDKVDMIFGSCLTTVAAAMVDIAAESEHRAAGRVPGRHAARPGRTGCSACRSRNTVMAHAMVDHMKKQGVKTVGFLGYTDAYGEQWLKEFTPVAEKDGIKLVATERFARPDTSVTPQALKLVSANPDAMLIVASGSGAAMPEMADRGRGYKGKIYQTHAAATKDLMRIGGKAVEGTFVVSGPAVIAEQLPDSHPSKKVADRLRAEVREGRWARARRNQFAGHAYDSQIVLEKIIAGGAEEGQARHQGVPRGDPRRHGNHGPHHLLARRDELDRRRPLGLHQRDRRDAARSSTATSRSNKGR